MEKDHICTVSEDKKYDIICIGMALVDSIVRGFDPKPISAAGYRAKEGSLHVGGEAVNEAIAASKLGAKTGILCSLGEDIAGDMVIQALSKYNVDTNLVLRSRKCQTPITTMLVNEDGTRMSVTNQAHRYNFHPENHIDCFTDTKAILLGSLFRAPFDDPDIIHSVVSEAKSNGLAVFADTKIPNFRKLTIADLIKTLPLIDYITPNEDEAKYYTGKEEPEEMADVFLETGIKNVIIKLGSKGCYFKNADMSLSLPAHKISAVDATGAGDNFIAAFASEILNGKTIEGALRFANACGAICTTAMGAATALIDRAQVNQFIAESKEDIQ